jgi:serpin B
MMHGHFDGDVASTPEYDAVPVPANGLVDVMVVVPKGDETPESVVALLEKRGLDSLRENCRPRQVDLSLPRFKARFHDSLKSALKGMGMVQAFSPEQADFRGVADVRPLWVDDVVHEAVLDVNEEGVEAAGGTAVILLGAPPATKTMSIRADRPLVVLLTVGSYPNLPLFAAVVRDPR